MYPGSKIASPLMNSGVKHDRSFFSLLYVQVFVRENRFELSRVSHSLLVQSAAAEAGVGCGPDYVECQASSGAEQRRQVLIFSTSVGLSHCSRCCLCLQALAFWWPDFQLPVSICVSLLEPWFGVWHLPCPFSTKSRLEMLGKYYPPPQALNQSPKRMGVWILQLLALGGTILSECFVLASRVPQGY